MKLESQYSYDLMMVLPHMGPGGSQRVVSTLLNHWAGEKRICLVTTHDDPPDAYDLDPYIERIRIKNKDAVGGQSNSGLLRILRRAIPLRNLGFLRTSARAICLQRLTLAKQFFEIFYHRFFLMLLLRKKIAISDRVLIWACWISFGLLSRSTYRRIRRLRSLFKEKKPQVVLSFLGATNLQVIIAGAGTLRKLIISERNDPAMQQLAMPWEQLRNSLYRIADVVTANSKGAIQTMRAFVPSDRLAYVPNPVLKPSTYIEVKGRRKVILSVGRLVEQKGLDVLIKAFARISDQIPDWRVEILGDGPLKDFLKALALEKGVLTKIRFCGHQENVDDYYHYASIFALPSRYEGTPNALVEAMTFGLPAIVSDGSPGPLEIVSNGFNGLVFPSEDDFSLARAILTLAGNEEVRIRMGSAARKISRRFLLGTVINEWEKVLYGR